MFSIIGLLAGFAFFIYIWWRILGKMGYFGWYRVGLLVLTVVPGIGIPASLLYLAFFQWPVHEDLELLRKRVRR
jgi:hypothetical protein